MEVSEDMDTSADAPWGMLVRPATAFGALDLDLFSVLAMRATCKTIAAHAGGHDAGSGCLYLHTVLRHLGLGELISRSLSRRHMIGAYSTFTWPRRSTLPWIVCSNGVSIPPGSSALCAEVITAALAERRLLLKVQRACFGHCALAGGFSTWLVARDAVVGSYEWRHLRLGGLPQDGDLEGDSNFRCRPYIRPGKFGDIDLFYDGSACRNEKDAAALVERLDALSMAFLDEIYRSAYGKEFHKVWYDRHESSWYDGHMQRIVSPVVLPESSDLPAIASSIRSDLERMMGADGTAAVTTPLPYAACFAVRTRAAFGTRI